MAFHIIGVVGASDPATATAALCGLAHAAGRALADAGYAVLTGGHHKWREPSVKWSALDGAHAAAKERRVRILGVVPAKISDRLTPKFGTVGIEYECSELEGGGLCSLYAHTRLRSQERDWINGSAVDALVALRPGQGGGTLREVEAALTANKPVVFLNSWEHFERWCEARFPEHRPVCVSRADQLDAALKDFQLPFGATFPTQAPETMPDGFVTVLPKLSAAWTAVLGVM